MRFKIDLKIFLFLIVFYFTKQLELYALIMIFAFVHELGHLIAGLMTGMQPEKLELKPYGVSILFKLFPKFEFLLAFLKKKYKIIEIIISIIIISNTSNFLFNLGFRSLFNFFCMNFSICFIFTPIKKRE